MSRTALITGVSGFAGAHLAKHLIDTGWTVHGTVRRSPCLIEGVQAHTLDIDDVSALRKVVQLAQPERVYHLAAIVDTVTTPNLVRLHRVNVLGTAALLEALDGGSHSCRVLHASSSFAYGRTSPTDQPVSESTPLRPVTPYGASKAASEAITLAWGRETGSHVLVTRAFQHTGPGHIGTYALADWASQLADGHQVIRCGNLDVFRDYLDVRDVVTAYATLAEHGQTEKVYNVCSGTPLSMRMLLEGLINAFDSKASINVDPQRLRPSDQPIFYGDPTLLETQTGWRPKYILAQTLQDLANFWGCRSRLRSDLAKQGARLRNPP